MLNRLILIAQLILLGSLSVSGKTLTLNQEKIQFDVPDAWTEQNVPGTKIYLSNSDQTKSFAIQFLTIPNNFTLNSPSFFDRDKKGTTGNGRMIINQGRGFLAGAETRSIDWSEANASGLSYTRETVLIRSGYAYALYASKADALPWKDDELNAIVSSFSFFRTTEVRPRTAIDEDEIGYPVAVIGAGVLLLAILALFTLMRRKK